MNLFSVLAILVNISVGFCRPEGELVAVTALIRHGARIPESFYPNDPYKNVTFPFVLGDLTNHGIREMYNVGKWLRDRYTPFLSLEYNPNEIYAQSVDYDRCVMSGEATLAGLYPPVSHEIWKKNLLWQPIPLHTSPQQQDIVVNMNLCPMINASGLLMQQTPIYQEIMARNEKYFQFVSEKAGENVTLATLYPLFDTLFSEIKLKLPLPKWAQEIYPHLVNLTIVYTQLETISTQQRQILVGPILHRIVSQFDRAISGRDFGTTKTIFRKFMTYYATEWILYDLTYSIGLPSIQIPDFGALYLIELRKNQSGKYYVNILYRHSTVPGTRAIPVSIKDTKFNLDYDKFKEYVGRYEVDPAEWVSLCKNFTNQTVQVNVTVPMS